MEAGNNLEQSVALVAAANKVVQDPNSVGSALRTISLRLRGTSVSVLEEMGEETDGVVESVSKMQEKIQALTGVNILTESGAYKETYEILREIGYVWEDMADIDQAALLELMAGKNRANTLAAILGNMEDLEGAYKSALDAEGSALKENEEYLNSIQGRIDLFTNSVQTMWMNFIDSDVVKFIVDLGTALVNFMDKFGLLPTLAGTLLPLKTAFNEIKESWKDINADNAIQIFGKSAKDATDSVNDLTDAIGKSADANNAGADAAENMAEADELEGQMSLFAADADRQKSTENLKNKVTQDLETASTEKGTAATIKDTIATKANVVATKALAAAKSLVKGLLIGLAISAVTSAISTLINYAKEAAERMNELTDAAIDSADELNDARDSVKDYKDQIHELRGVLADSNTTEQEAYDARAQLIDIQNQLIDKFGQEAEGINLVTGAIEDQIGAIDKLTQKASEDWIANNNEAYQNAIKEMEKEYSNQQFVLSGESGKISYTRDAFGGQEAHYTTTNQTLGSEAQYIRDAYNEGLKKIIEDAGGSIKETLTEGSYASYGYYGKTFTASFEGKTVEELDAIFRNMQSFLIQFSSDNNVDLNSQITQLEQIRKQYINEDYKKAKELYDEGRQQEAYAKYASDYGAMLDAEEEFYQSTTDEARLNALEKYTQETVDAFKAAGGQIKEDGTWEIDPESATAHMQDYFKEMKDKFTEEEFELKVKTNEDELKNQLTNIIQESGEQGLSALDDNQMKDLAIRYQAGEFEAGPEGTFVDYSRYTKEQVSGIAALQAQADEAGISVDALIDILVNLGLIAGRPLEGVEETVQAISETYSTLAATVEGYASINEILNEAIADNTKLSQEQGDALKELIGSEEEYADCIDESNGYIVKNSTLLRKLVAQKKQEQKTTIQQAKSYGQLQYKNTVGQLQQVINAMALEVKANGLVSSSTLNTIGVLREQLSALKQTIQQYALLELSLSDAANAYSEFEAAKERDAQLTYGDSMIEALQTINDGFKTGQVGTEAFQYAVKIFVPESEYAHIDDIEQRMIAIHDYIDKNPLFADWFTIDEGEFSITLDNINNFIDDAFSAGLFTNDSSGNFFLTDAIKNAEEPLKEFADQLGEAFGTEVTEGSVLAMLTEMEKYDASWGNIITDLTTTPLDRAINDATDALENALTAQEEFIRSGGNLNSDEYKKLEEAVASARGELDKASQAAIDNAQTYTQVEAVLKGVSGEVKYTQEQANALARSLGLVNENGECTIAINEDGTLSLTQSQVDELNERLTGLAKPTILDVQLAYDEIDRQLQELNTYLSDPSNYDGTILTELSITNEGEAKAKVDELTADRDAIELVYNITATSTAQDQNTMDKLATWETNGVSIVITGDTTSIDGTIAEINATEMDDKPVDIITDPTQANADIDSVDDNNIADKEPGIYMQGVSVALTNIDSIGDALDDLPSSKHVWIYTHQSNTSDINGTAHVGGTAFAGGDWGAPRTEMALTGELGPEMIVRGNKWFTVGDNGAEFTQIKKGDIIFNHKQTEDLLSKGYVTSRGKMAGGAFASGTAYYKTFSGYVGDDDVFENGSENWMDPYTNTSDSLSDAADSLSNAADEISDATDEFKEIFDWVEVRLEELDETLSLLSAQLENAVYYNEKNSIIDGMINVNNTKLENLNAGYDEYAEYASKLLAEVPEKYRDAAQDGAIAIEKFVGEADEATLEAINNYREWAQKAADLKQQAQEVIATIRDLAIQKFDNAYEAGDVRATVEDSQTEKLQNAVDYDEERGLITSDEYYIAMMENSNKKIEYLTEARKAMQKELNAAVEAGQIERGSNEWYELLDQMYQIDVQIDEATIELEEFQNAINDLYWDNLEQLTNRLDYLKDETQSLIDLMANDDLVADPQKRKYEGGTVEYWTADDVDWTDEGLASLGLYAQQMEIAEYTARQYAEAIDDLEKDYKAGLYSENEYIEKLEELKDVQYENIEAYYDAQDAIVELNEARVDSIKDGIEKEIEAYEELIEKQKEQLDSEKDLYDFQKNTAEQQKNIAQIERQLAALANDTSLSAAAKRKQLEQELAEAQYELQDTYYNRSVEDKQTALDKELEDFNAEKDAELTKWEEYLTNVELVIADSLNVVQANALGIYDTLNAKATEYDLTLSDSIMTPWQDGALAVSDYQNTFDTAMSSTMDQLEALKNKWQEVIDKMAEVGKVNVTAINKENATYAAATKPEPAKKQEAPKKEEAKKQEVKAPSLSVGSYVEVKPGTKWYADSYGGGASGNARSGKIKYINTKGSHSYNIDGLGWVKKTDIKGYAKGTKSLNKSGVINIDELGEELLLHAKNGRLTYMEKGSGVVPADLTSNLMEWGKLDPTSMLEQNRPSMNVHPEIHNTEVNLSMTYGDILHIEEFKGDNPEDIAKIVAKQFEKHTKDLNNALRKFVR